MPSHKRSKIQRERDLVEIARRYLRGESQRKIALALGVTRQQIQYDLREIRARWREQAVVDFEQAIIEQLARIDQLEREYWEQYELSKAGKAKKIITVSGKRPKQLKQPKQEDDSSDNQKGIERVTQTSITEETPGDPRYLQGVQWCIQERARLLGLYAPDRIDITAKGREVSLPKPPDIREVLETADGTLIPELMIRAMMKDVNVIEAEYTEPSKPAEEPAA